ncbi:MAG: aminotransferase class IV, partial [bacterium]
TVSSTPLAACPRKRTSYASVMEERSQSPEWDVLYCGLEGDVWETGIANILWMKQGTVYCPRSDGHWLSGTVLEATLETAEAVGLGTERRSARWDELGSFCWISNSLFGFLPVNRIATEDYDPSPPDGWMELRERLLSDKVFPRWHEISLFN